MPDAETSGSSILARCLRVMPPFVCALLFVLIFAGCQSNNYSVEKAKQAVATTTNSEALILREGDVIKISFPGTPNLDTTQQIRRDGKISLSIVGEVDASGMTLPALEKQLVKLYEPQLVSKQVMVSLVSSTLPVFVTGAVIHPGKVVSDHPITVLEAIMESGGFDYTKANLKNVLIIRNERGRMTNISQNLKSVLAGKQCEPFYLKPSDIVYVPEKFSWF